MVGQFQRRPNRNERLNWKYAFFGNVQAVLGLFGCIFWTNKLNQKLHCNDAYHVRFRAFLLFFHFFDEYVDKFLENATQTRPQISLNQMQTKMHWAQCKLYWAHASCIESNALCIHFFALFWLFTSHFNYSFQTLARLVKIGAPFSQEFGVPCWVCEPVLSPSLSWPDLKHTFGQLSFEKKPLHETNC